jgi:hypothetical protein
MGFSMALENIKKTQNCYQGQLRAVLLGYLSDQQHIWISK